MIAIDQGAGRHLIGCDIRRDPLRLVLAEYWQRLAIQCTDHDGTQDLTMGSSASSPKVAP
jgi:hypothetical protein